MKKINKENTDIVSTPRERVLEITKKIGMKYTVAAVAMNITYNTFTNKMNPNALGHSFNNKNVEDLKNFINKKNQEIELL